MATCSVIKRVIFQCNIKHLKKKNSRWISVSASRKRINNNVLGNPNTVDIPRMSIPEFIFSEIEKYSELTGFECSITRRNCTFGEIRTKSRNLGKVLRKKFGLNGGDVSLIHLENTPEFPVAVLGCLAAGLIVSSSNPISTPDEIAKQLKNSGSKIIITSCNLYDNAVKASEKVQTKLPIICIKTKQGQALPQGGIDFTELTNTLIDIPDLDLPNPDDTAILPYSSGTTGLPKGARLSHSNIVANLVQFSHPDINFVDKTSGRDQEIIPGVLPMFHIYGLVIATLYCMIKGAKIVTLPKFQPDSFIDVLKNFDITLLFAAPPLVIFLTQHPEVRKEHFRAFRKLMSGAAPLGATDEERFLKKLAKDILVCQGYGLTETSPLVTIMSKKLKETYGEACLGSIGKVIPNTEVKLVKLDDHTGTPLGPNEAGELLVKGPQVMQGYHENEEATKATFQNEWLKTGDLAYYNEHGLLFITDRVKELIKVKGFQVAPAELEALLRSHPKVADVAVIGIPHDTAGEVPRAFIQPIGPIDEEEINEFVNEKVAKYKRLEGGIELVKQIPKNPTGKILRRELKRNFLDQYKKS